MSTQDASGNVTAADYSVVDWNDCDDGPYVCIGQRGNDCLRLAEPRRGQTNVHQARPSGWRGLDISHEERVAPCPELPPAGSLASRFKPDRVSHQSGDAGDGCKECYSCYLERLVSDAIVLE